MIKDSLNSLEVFIRLLILVFFYTNSQAQILPSLHGFHNKKESSLPEQSSSLTFDGSNDRITTNGTLNNLSGFTLELWLYPHSASSSMAIIGENNLIEFGYGSSKSLRIWTWADATGNSVSPAAAANYKLLYKSCTECDFIVKATGASSSDDIITFSNVALQDGFYAIASTDSNL